MFGPQAVVAEHFRTVSKTLIWILLCILAPAVGCTPRTKVMHDHQESTTQPASVLSGRLTVTGSSTVAPLVAEIAKRFEARHAGVRIDVQTGGSGKGIADARNGVADIGMASRRLKAGERDLVAHQIAADGVGLIVHRDNRVAELTAAEVVDVFTDRSNNWQEVRGLDLPITVVHKAEGRATLEVFLNHFSLANPQVRADVIVGDNQHGIKTVAGTPGAIGYVSIGAAEAAIAGGVPIRLLPIDGVAATSAQVAAGAYPLTRPLNLVTAGGLSPLARAFVTFCQSEDVHDTVVSQHFVPLAN